MDYDAAGNLLVDPQKMANDSFKNAGWALGFAAGWLVERRFVHFETEGTLQQKCCRAVWGIIAFMLVNFPATELVKLIVPGGVGPASHASCRCSPSCCSCRSASRDGRKATRSGSATSAVRPVALLYQA